MYSRNCTLYICMYSRNCTLYICMYSRNCTLYIYMYSRLCTLYTYIYSRNCTPSCKLRVVSLVESKLVHLKEEYLINVYVLQELYSILHTACSLVESQLVQHKKEYSTNVRNINAINQVRKYVFFCFVFLFFSLHYH